MNDQANNEKPAVYALHQDGGAWQISRREFLKAAGIGAAAIGIGMNSRFVSPAYAEESLEELCKNAPAHEEPIQKIAVTPDGRYLLSYDGENVKCWDFGSYALVNSKKLKSANILAAGLFGSSSGLIFYLSGEKKIRVYLIPDMKDSEEKTIDVTWIGSDLIEGIIPGQQGDIYITRLDQKNAGNKMYRITKLEKGTGDHTYSDTKTLFDSADKIRAFTLIENESKLLVLTGDGHFRIADLSDGSEREISSDAPDKETAYAVAPGDAAVLFAEGKDPAAYRLVSLTDGSVRWAQKLTEDDEISGVCISPDGTFGVLLGTKKLWLVSMADGTIVKELKLSEKFDKCRQIAASADGTKIAAALKNSLLFISLPEFRIIGCPVDLNAMKDDSKGITISSEDPVTGNTVTYTLPCGAPIPVGAVCTCNCVAGTIPVCSCVGHTCSCNSHKPGYGGGHYWHPN